MFNLFRRITLSIRALVWLLAGMAALTMVVGSVMSYSELHGSLYDARIRELQNEADSAAGLMRAAAARDGEQALAKSVALLRPVRFGDNGYYFIEGLDGVARMMPTAPDLEGKDITGVADPAGRRLFADMLALARDGRSGSVRYAWPKPGDPKPYEKISAIAPVPELGVLVGTGAYFDDIQHKLMSALGRLSLVSAPFLLAFVGGAYWVGRTISRRLQATTRAMNKLAEGDFAIVLPGLDRKDELGAMARAVEAFKRKAREAAEAEEARREANRREVAETRRREMMALAQEFENAIGAVVGSVASSAHQLEAVAGALASGARQTGEQAEAGSKAAEDTSHNVQSVAAATEQLSHSAQEIAAQASRSHAVAQESCAVAEKTRARMSELDRAIQHIGGVVGMIAEIAEQTNMLALNATIEAARAGESGRGFAVVASEVKNLASQTAKATTEISTQIDNVRRASEETSACLGDMSGGAAEVLAISQAIAGSIDMQTQATNEIAQNVADTSALTRDLGAVIADVRDAARDTGGAAEEAQQAVSQLAEHAERLRKDCESFLSQVRAA